MGKVMPADIINVIKGLNWNIDVNKLIFDKDLSLQNVDSLDLMSLLFALEERFSIKIDDESLKQEKWSSIDKIANEVNIIKNILKEDKDE